MRGCGNPWRRIEERTEWPMIRPQSRQLLAASEVALVEAALTVPHPDLQPDLPIVTSDDVTAIAAAVSPESSYRLVGELLSALERRKDDLTVRILLSSTYRDNWEQSKASLAQFNLFQTMKAMNRDYFD